MQTAQPDDIDVKLTVKTVQFPDGVHDAQDGDVINNDTLNLVTDYFFLVPRYFPLENALCLSKANQATWYERLKIS